MVEVAGVRAAGGRARGVKGDLGLWFLGILRATWDGCRCLVGSHDDVKVLRAFGNVKRTCRRCGRVEWDVVG